MLVVAAESKCCRVGSLSVLSRPLDGPESGGTFDGAERGVSAGFLGAALRRVYFVQGIWLGVLRSSTLRTHAGPSVPVRFNEFWSLVHPPSPRYSPAALKPGTLTPWRENESQNDNACALVRLRTLGCLPT